jgi:hypothetical protein
MPYQAVAILLQQLVHLIFTVTVTPQPGCAWAASTGPINPPVTAMTDQEICEKHMPELEEIGLHRRLHLDDDLCQIIEIWCEENGETE